MRHVDQQHVSRALKALGLARAKGVGTPGTDDVGGPKASEVSELRKTAKWHNPSEEASEEDALLTGHFFHKDLETYILVHGDDFFIVGRQNGREHVPSLLRSASELSKVVTLGSGPSQSRTATILGRTLLQKRPARRMLFSLECSSAIQFPCHRQARPLVLSERVDAEHGVATRTRPRCLPENCTIHNQIHTNDL